MKNNELKIFFLICLLFLSCDNNQKNGFVIKNVNIIPIWQHTLLRDYDIKIVSGKIFHIDKNIDIGTKDTVIDGNSGYLLPGLWDMHTHLPNRKKNGFGYKEYLALNLLSGVTHIRNMRRFDSISNLKEKIRNKSILSPNVYFTPTPVIQSYFAPAAISRKNHPPRDSISFYAKKYRSEGFEYWKILSLPKGNYFDTLAKYAKSNQLKLVGHISKSVGLEKSISKGYSCIEHLQGYSALFSDTLLFNNILTLTKQKDVFNCATLDWYHITYLQYPLDEIYNREYLKYIPPKTVAEWKKNVSGYLEELKLLSKDSLRNLNHSDSTYIANKNIILKKLFDSGCKLLISPDANGMFQVPGFSMLDEMKLHEKAGIPKPDILKMATLNAAEWMGKKNKGFIKEGADADFVLFEKNPLKDLDNLRIIKGIYSNNGWINEQDIKNKLKKIEQLWR